MVNDEKVDTVQALMNSSRLKLLTVIDKNGRANVSQLSKATNLDRSTVVYHMSLLAKVGIVKEQIIPVKPASSPGIMGRYFSIDKAKLSAAVDLLCKELEDITPRT